MPGHQGASQPVDRRSLSPQLQPVPPQQHPSSSNLNALQKILGHEFSEPDLLRTALRPPSAITDNSGSNAQLAWLGSAVWGLLAATDCYHADPGASVTDMQRTCELYTGTTACAAAADRVDLAEWMEPKLGGRPLSSSAKADLFRAVLASAFVDSGYTLSVPAGVYVTSMGNTTIASPSLIPISSPQSLLTASPAAPTAKGTDPQAHTLSGPLTSSGAPYPAASLAAAQSPVTVRASKQPDATHRAAIGGGAVTGATEAEAPGPEPCPRAASGGVPRFLGPFGAPRGIKRSGKRQRMASLKDIIASTRRPTGLVRGSRVARAARAPQKRKR